MSGQAEVRKFETVVIGVLKKAGWTRKGKAAFFKGGDAVINVSLQRSKFDQLQFINLGIWLLAFGSAERPRHSQCHLQFRLENIFEELQDEIAGAEDPTRAGQDDLARLEVALVEVEPELRRLTDIDRLRQLVAAGLLSRGLIRKEARELLLQQ